MNRALITGITGQDGFFLAKLLLSKGYQVTGFLQKKNQDKPLDSNDLPDTVEMLWGDISNEADIIAAIKSTQPDELYHLASQSRPDVSWGQAAKMLQANSLGALHVFEAVRSFSPTTRIFHASSSEMYGNTTSLLKNEKTPFNPINPYAASKLYAHQMAKIYRDSHQLFIANGILFNHESERRPLHFVTQKVAYGAACASLGIANSPDYNEKGQAIVFDGKMALGHLEIARDWGYAPDFVRAMWLMLQQDKPDDFVIGTGQLHTLKSLCEIAYRSVGHNWQDHVFSDSAFIRPIEVTQTIADSTKAEQILGWTASVSFQEMIEKMIDFQIERLRTSLKLKPAKSTVSA
jgi:GDPmannose 4,6-dehydratase